MSSLALALRSRPATIAEVDAAIARLDDQPGLYLGCDAGASGLHPDAAVLVTAVALALRLPARGAPQLQAQHALGHTLLRQPAVQAWQARPPDDTAQALQHLQDLLAGLCADATTRSAVMLCGALRFECWRLRAAQESALAALAGQLSDSDAQPPLGRPEAAEPPRGAADHAQRGSVGAPALPLGTLFMPQALLQREDGQWLHHELYWTGDEATASPGTAAAPSHTVHGSPPTDDDHAPGGHAQMIRRAQRLLGHGAPLLSLTLSQSFRRRLPPGMGAARGFARLRAVNPAPATFLFHDGAGNRLFGASPDMHLIINGPAVDALPVCGTVARPPGPVGEAQALRELLNTEVDAASLAVCTDALRADLAPHCVPGSLHLADRQRPMSLATVVHTVDRLRGTLRPGTGAWAAILATSAPPMVTGAPRAAALAAIATLEASPRGWYGGLVVMVRADGRAMAGTILRAAWLRDAADGACVAEVRTGGDLMADSDPEREEQESRLKALSLWRALGLQDQAATVHAAVADAAREPTQGSGAPQPPGHSPGLTVALHAQADALGPGLHDTLLGLGLVVHTPGNAPPGAAAPANVDVLAASGDIHPQRAAALATAAQRPLLAVGDAALALLAWHGLPVQAVAPRHGRLAMARRAADAPTGLPAEGAGPAAWPVGLYLSGELTPNIEGALRCAGWQTWLQASMPDADGAPGPAWPVLLVHAQQRQACVLFRPDSMLSAPAAREWLRAVLLWLADQPRPRAMDVTS